MSLVETVSGPVPVQSLGLTLTHEHIVPLEVELRLSAEQPAEEGAAPRELPGLIDFSPWAQPTAGR
jgi:predicted metal-dependent phosphotriesterase family hydrolase